MTKVALVGIAILGVCMGCGEGQEDTKTGSAPILGDFATGYASHLQMRRALSGGGSITFATDATVRILDGYPTATYRLGRSGPGMACSVYLNWAYGAPPTSLTFPGVPAGNQWYWSSVAPSSSYCVVNTAGISETVFVPAGGLQVWMTPAPTGTGQVGGWAYFNLPPNYYANNFDGKTALIKNP